MNCYHIHLCGDNDLTEVLSYCFSGYEIQLISVIPEINLLRSYSDLKKIDFPKLKFDERIMLASLDNRSRLEELLVSRGFRKNLHWVLFS